jgi:hypothetical protein
MAFALAETPLRFAWVRFQRIVWLNQSLAEEATASSLSAFSPLWLTFSG